MPASFPYTAATKALLPDASTPGEAHSFWDSQEQGANSDTARQQATKYLVSRGCTADEARHAVALLLGRGVPPAQLEDCVRDLMTLVETAMDSLFAE